jgi:hypothetical protein
MPQAMATFKTFLTCPTISGNFVSIVRIQNERTFE